jgi:hypothetical protein
LQEVEQTEQLRTYFTKLVGVSHTNPNGTHRQEIIARCRQWEELRFRPEPANPHDECAVGVCRKNGEQIGHLNRDLAEIVSGYIGRGWRYLPILKKILDDGKRGHDRGVVLLVIAAGPNVPLETAKNFGRNALAEAKEDERCRAIDDIRRAGMPLPDDAPAAEVAAFHDALFRLDHFYADVDGTTERNPDGTERQSIIRQIKPLETLHLCDELKNPLDPNVIAVLRDNGQQVGWLPDLYAPELRKDFTAGYRFMVIAVSITGGRPKQPALGVDLCIISVPPGCDEGALAAYVKHRLAKDAEFIKVSGLQRA